LLLSSYFFSFIITLHFIVLFPFYSASVCILIINLIIKAPLITITYRRRHIHYYLTEQTQLHRSIFSGNVKKLFNFVQMASFRVDVHKNNGCPKYLTDRNNDNSKHWKRAASSSKNPGALSALC